MKKIKIYDLFISLSLMLAGVIAGILWGIKTGLYSYYLTGGWQLASMLFHTHYNCFTKKGSVRYYYHWLAAICCCCLITATWYGFFGSFATIGSARIETDNDCANALFPGNCPTTHTSINLAHFSLTEC